jgi:hypothetical protein
MSDINNKFLKTLKKVKSGIARPATSGLVVVSYLKKVLFFKSHECIVIACMPKSGSTFLSSALSKLVGSKTYFFPTYGGGRNEQNFYPPALIDIYGKKSVSQIHLKATEANLRLIEKFSVKPIILVRNIFDVVISLRDHFHNESTSVPFVWANDKFFELDESVQLDFIIELAIPWYINFYVSWFAVYKEGIVNPIWLTYEEVITDPKVKLRFIMDSYSIKKSDEEIENALQQVGRKKVRFNKGVSGRGYQMLTETQIQRIKDFTRFYPWVDFSKIGIPKDKS